MIDYSALIKLQKIGATAGSLLTYCKASGSPQRKYPLTDSDKLEVASNAEARFEDIVKEIEEWLQNVKSS